MTCYDFRKTRKLRHGSAAIAAAGLGLVHPAFADVAADGGPGLGDIVVTAQKRETNLQQTPISISVLDGEDLANRHAISLDSLQDGSIPSLRVAPFFARRSALTVAMRGVGGLVDANQPARDQGVGIYLDGVYLGRAQGLGTALYDIERIEVLKGPQGTLFGRNTEGGAVSIVTRKPTGEADMSLTAGASNFGGWETVIHTNLPEIAGFKIKVDALRQKRGGTIDNPLPGQRDFNSYDKIGLHAAVLWEPAANFSALYGYDLSRDDSTPYYVQLVTRGSLPLAPLIRIQPDRAEAANVGVPLQYSVGNTYGHVLTLDWKAAEAIEVRSISSYRHLTQTQYDNGEENLSVFAPNGLFSRYSLANFYQHQYSEELQVLGTLPQVTFVAGGFYYHEWVRDNAWSPFTNRWNATGTAFTILPVPVGQTPFPDRASIAITDSFAAFGQATWTPALAGEMFHLTLGGRYSHDKKKGQLYLVNGATPVVFGVVGPLPLRFKSNRFDPLVNLAVDLAPGVNAYGKWSTGYKAGGANSRSLTYRAFGPESVSTFEAGLKSELLDRHVRVNLAAYTSAYKNAQIDFNAIIPGVNRGTLETTNAAGNGRIKGIEADLTVAPVTGLTLGASYAYAHVRLPAAPNPFVTGSPLVVVYPLYTPRHAASGSVDYALPLEHVTLAGHFDLSYSGRQYTSSSDPTLTDKALIANARVSAGEIALGHSGGRFELAAWSRNLFNKSYKFLRNTSAALGSFAIYNEPRTYGVEGTLRF